MALSAAKLEYFRKYREEHKEETKAAFKCWYAKKGEQRSQENPELSRAVKRKSYYLSVGRYIKADEEQKLVDEIRKTNAERLASAKRIMRRYRYKHVEGLPEKLDAPPVCEVCGSDKKICLDHCHVTNKFRGWLCDNCNVTLGIVKDDVGLLAALIVYLKSKERGGS